MAEISHKSEHGLVRVGLKQSDDVARHFAEIVAKLTEMTVPFEGVLSAEMLDQGSELVIGGHIDLVFGPVVIVGEGGIAVEPRLLVGWLSPSGIGLPTRK